MTGLYNPLTNWLAVNPENIPYLFISFYLPLTHRNSVAILSLIIQSSKQQNNEKDFNDSCNNNYCILFFLQ